MQHLSKKTGTEFGFASVGALPIDSELCDAISAEFAKNSSPDVIGYIANSSEIRTDPRKLYPWAATVISVAIPFENIPAPLSVLPKGTVKELSGKVANYAVKRDYHIYGRKKLAEFANLLQQNCTTAGNIPRMEISIDTAPVAEKIIAALAGTGSKGLNSCLLVKNHGTGCFLGEIFTDMKTEHLRQIIPLTDSIHHKNINTLPEQCHICRQCIKKCPTGAICGDGSFRCSLCRSFLTMEQRADLTENEQKLLGEWIFGCDICTSACPESSLSAPVNLDLEWLLLSPAAEIKKAIHNTAMEYAGVTLLRRNALAVLANYSTPVSLELIRTFASQTGSERLKKYAARISG